MNAERKKRWWEKNLGSHKKELQQRTENNKKKRLKLTESEIIEQRATERETKRKSRENQQIMWSRQEVQGAKMKDKNRKALERSKINSTDSQKDYSTPRVQKHRALKVKINFTKTSKPTSRKKNP